MALVSYADSALSILPPVIAISLAILSRRVLLSLGLGILTGILMLSDFSVSLTAAQLLERTVALVWDGDGLASWNLYTIGFLLSMGLLMALISLSGGTRAFAQWARSRLHSGKDAQLMTLFLGAIVFIDDYFNALLVGNVARPITDQHGVSRERLAYCIDSTSAPVCVMSPISTWGAYIMSLLASILVTHGFEGMSALSAFAQMIPMNLYALSSVALLLCVVMMDLDFGPMAKAQRRAALGQRWDESKGSPSGDELGLPEADNGKVLNLLGPLVLLVTLVVTLMLVSGSQSMGDVPFELIGALENADGSWAMFTSGWITVGVTLIALLLQGVSVEHIAMGVRKGLSSMLPAVYILLMAWTIAGVISDLQTGSYLASLAADTLPVFLVPVIIFALSAFAAFSTGTSYGTFAIMLPIAANMAMALEPALFLPAMAAVLAGGVFGDHCSPISDTTILSSTGSGCHHMDHVATQLPYALLAAVVAVCGYMVLGLTGSNALAIVISAMVLISMVLVLRQYRFTTTMNNLDVTAP